MADKLYELQEDVLINYRRSYDLDIAFLKAGAAKEQKEALLQDKEFMFRVKFADADLKERIVDQLRDAMASEDEKLAYKAAVDMGTLFYRERFKNEQNNADIRVPDKIILKGRRADDSRS